ncbi:unnamed protein product [Urochloa humidicola]
MADRFRGYGAPSSYDRDRAYPDYFPPEGSLASYYASRPSVLPVPGGPGVHRNNVALQPRAYGLDGPAEVINPALPGLSGLPAVARARGLSPLEEPSLAGLSGLAPARAPGLPAVARARGPSPLEEPSLAGLSGLAPARALGPSLLEEPAVVARSTSLGKGAGIPDIEHHSPLPNLDGPSEDESNILFVDCLPTDCTRREVAHLFRLFDGFKDIRVVHKEPRRSGDKAYVLCFVEFENAKSARTAMNKLRGYRFDDRKPDSPLLDIQFARFPFRLPATLNDRARLIAR